MGLPTSKVGYTSAATGRGDHEVHKGHVVVLGEKKHNNVWDILRLNTYCVLILSYEIETDYYI
jgi:hypothetical protein